ncbi:MAG TPA: DNA-binding protein YbiB [Burkholderiaceae bacterium]|nr:DNA-binding protein YbiB [Burkholderiaceae bacterium]
MKSYGALIKEVGRGARGARSLERAQAQALYGEMLDGQVPDMELGALLVALRIKGESCEELLGFHDALQARTARLEAPAGPRLVLLPALNGARKLANLMPLVALLLAQRGVPVLIHGRHDFDTREDSFALLQALDLDQAADLPGLQQALLSRRLAVAPLRLLCPGLDALMALRPRLGVRNSAHIMAKLLDPAPGRSLRVVAVTHPEYLDSMSEALPILCRDSAGQALLMRACEGEAHAHLRRKAWMRRFGPDGSTELQTGDEDLSQPLLEQPGIADNAALIRDMLSGRRPLPARIAEQVQALEMLAKA